MISCLAIVNSNIIKRFGSKTVLMLGVGILGLGEILSGWTVHNIGGLFVTLGLVMGLGTSLIFMASRFGPRLRVRLEWHIDPFVPVCSPAPFYPLNTFSASEDWLSV